MTREFLKELGLEDEVINKIMAEHGNGINKSKAEAEKMTAENEQLKADLEKANKTLDGLKDYEEVKNEVAKYKAEIENSKRDYEKKLASMELNGKIKDFTNSKNFVNDLTKEAINSRLFAALESEENKGKSIEELFNSITEGMENIFVDNTKPTPPKVVDNMTGGGGEESGVIEAFKRLNPGIKI